MSISDIFPNYTMAEFKEITKKYLSDSRESHVLIVRDYLVKKDSVTKIAERYKVSVDTVYKTIQKTLAKITGGVQAIDIANAPVKLIVVNESGNKSYEKMVALTQLNQLMKNVRKTITYNTVVK